MLSIPPVIAFDEYARPGREELDLEVGALLIASDAYPHLAIDAELARLDALAVGLDAEALAALPVEDAAAALAEHLFRRHGFRGNEADYGDPRNSYLNEVLERRLGIPISLSIVLLALARRVGVKAHGVSFPGHFLVRFERPRSGPLVVDPFHGGRAMSHGDLERLLRRSAGPSAKLQVDHLKPAAPRAILTRVLQNLKSTFLARGDLPRALVAAARIVTLVPREPWAVRDRGILQAQLGALGGARNDLLRYLELAPEASDVAAVRKVLTRMGGRAATLN